MYADKLDSQSLEISATIMKALRNVFNDNDARFKSPEQAQAIKETLKRDTDLLVNLPTGGGKTLVYQLPILMERDMTTVVIVPFVALVDQVEEEFEKLKISCHIWKKNVYGVENAQAIIVSVEHAIMPEFQDLLIQLESTNRLARIVFDECHTILTHREFRDVMRRVAGVVRCVSAQLVLLTATLPPNMEERVRIILGCESWKVIRKVSDRKELKYSVKVLGNEVETMRDVNREIGLLLYNRIKDWKKDGRGLIYCLKTDWAKELAQYLNEKFGREICGVYHAKMDKSERKKALSAWKEGKIKFLAATSALGAGLDYGQVRTVIHQGHARNLIEFGQESGRAGRDGKEAESVTFFWRGLEPETRWIKKEEKEEMIRWIMSKDCRKKWLSIYLHGFGEDCLSQRDGEFCDNCEKALEGSSEWSVGIKVGRKRGRDVEAMEVSDAVDLKEMIGELKGTCTLCWINEKVIEKPHVLPRCE